MYAENKIYLECTTDELKQIENAKGVIEKIVNELGKVTSGCYTMDTLIKAKDVLDNIIFENPIE